MNAHGFQSAAGILRCICSVCTLPIPLAPAACSRIPVHRPGDRSQVLGILLVKVRCSWLLLWGPRPQVVHLWAVWLKQQV